jgi:hypothetical protein
MRRTAVVRLALVAATMFLAACADLSTAPKAPERTRSTETVPSNGAADTVRSDTINTRGSNQQGSSV